MIRVLLVLLCLAAPALAQPIFLGTPGMVELTWTNPVNMRSQFFVTAWSPAAKRVVTNLVWMTNWVDVEIQSDGGPWVTVLTTNRPPVRVRTRRSGTYFFRLSSYWQ
jgi:hypothetical protein